MGVHRDDDLVVVSLDLRDDTGDAVTRWLVDAGTVLFGALRDLLLNPPASPDRACVLIIDPATQTPSHAARVAACALVRGAVLRLAPYRLEARLTVVRVRPDQLPYLPPILAILGRNDAAYVPGAHLDLVDCS